MRLAVVSATPSIRPITAIRTLSTLARNSGRRCTSISLATSLRKLVTERTQTFLGRVRILDVRGLPFRPEVGTRP